MTLLTDMHPTERILFTEYLVYDVHEKPKDFVKSRPESQDIFFLRDDVTVHIAERSSILIWHGKTKIPTENIRFVYAGYEKEFLLIEDYQKMIRGIYHGRNVKTEPIDEYRIVWNTDDY